MKFEEKIGTHIVIKVEDVKQLDLMDTTHLGSALNAIGKIRKSNGKEPYPKYYIVNADEPYAQKVLEVIKNGENRKNKIEEKIK